MEGKVEDYQELFHTGKILGAWAMAQLAPTPGMRVLDLGCGDGLLSRQMSDAGADVVGVDVDPAFVSAAVSQGINAFVKDGHALDCVDEYDRVFSNATLHWLSADPARVLTGAFRALRHGGQLVAEFGGEGNVYAVVDALEAELRRHGHDPVESNPWFFPSDEEYSAMLVSAGFVVKHCELVDAPTPLPDGTDVSGWLRTFCKKWLRGLDAATADAILHGARKRLALLEGGRWTVNFVRLRVVAEKPMRPSSPRAEEDGEAAM